jgi:hypothetical protein
MGAKQCGGVIEHVQIRQNAIASQKISANVGLFIDGRILIDIGSRDYYLTYAHPREEPKNHPAAVMPLDFTKIRRENSVFPDGEFRVTGLRLSGNIQYVIVRYAIQHALGTVYVPEGIRQRCRVETKRTRRSQIAIETHTQNRFPSAGLGNNKTSRKMGYFHGSDSVVTR